jgi:hypothetical protein
MASNRQQSRKKRQQLWLPVLQQTPLGVNPALLQQIQTSTTATLNQFNSQGAYQNAVAQRNTGFAVYKDFALGNIIGALGQGATPQTPQATNFGGAGGAGGGGGAAAGGGQ